LAACGTGTENSFVGADGRLVLPLIPVLASPSAAATPQQRCARASRKNARSNPEGNASDLSVCRPKYNKKPSAVDEEPSGRNGKLRPGEAGSPSHRPPEVRFSRAAEKFWTKSTGSPEIKFLLGRSKQTAEGTIFIEPALFVAGPAAARYHSAILARSFPNSSAPVKSV
jgi:hypothetical protein